MELNWTTFILEVINFLVLIWILKRFLYKPVLTMIAQRREAIAKTLSDANTKEQQAQQLEAQYRDRLGDWEREREAARETLHQALESERAKLMKNLHDELQRERERMAAVELQRRSTLQQQSETAALKLAEQFTRRLLQRLATPALETQLINLVAADLTTLSNERLETLRHAIADGSTTITIHSAFALGEEQRTELQSAFRKRLNDDLPHWQFEEDPELITGLRINIGAWRLDANLRDELIFFSNATHAGQ